MQFRRCHRYRIALVVILGLLFQQAATVAYACTMTRMPAEPVPMAEDCAEMGMERATESPALCEKHCTPDQSLVSDHVVLSVPALAVPPASFDLVLAEPVSHVVLVEDVSIDRSDPPPRLRYCSLLI